MKKIIAIMLAAVMAMAVLPLSACAKGLSGTVSTNGSTSMEKVIGILSEQFMEDNGDVTITYDATGSGTGIEAAANGTADIGLASRALKAAEVEKGLVATTVALDGIAIIVNENCPVDDLTVEQIAAIFTGEITDWAEFGGKGEIACIGREAGSGTRDGFESITKTADKCVLKQELTSTGAVIAAVKSSENAIGYASFAAVEGQEGIKVLTVEGVECTAENIIDGTYVIQRPFNLVTLENAELSEAAKAFFDYMISEDAAELITMAGAVPVAAAEAAEPAEQQ
ncbi:MAG: phosphate ABC transporter substrate-binding protein [Clostridia bacterium]|nr:phosphate ABC transporter substrate-binding protein [Clostridia bacterium]